MLLTPPHESDRSPELWIRLFNPNLKPPRTLQTPSPPALALSKLPGPCAEVDERPTQRVRRFRLWRENCPDLRLAVLDPRRRNHLKRYQTFTVPNSWSPPLRGVRKVPVFPPLTNKLVDPPPVRALLMPRAPDPQWPNREVSKFVKRQRWLRLLQYKYVVDQEHERRFRLGMLAMASMVIGFERAHLEFESSSVVRWKQYESIDLNMAKDIIRFWQDIGPRSDNIYTYLCSSNLPIYPLHRRKEVRAAVKAEKKEKARKDQRKAAKRAADDSRRRVRLATLILADERHDDQRAGELDELETLRQGREVHALLADTRAEQCSEVIKAKERSAPKRNRRDPKSHAVTETKSIPSASSKAQKRRDRGSFVPTSTTANVPTMASNDSERETVKRDRPKGRVIFVTAKDRAENQGDNPGRTHHDVTASNLNLDVLKDLLIRMTVEQRRDLSERLLKLQSSPAHSDHGLGAPELGPHSDSSSHPLESSGYEPTKDTATDLPRVCSHIDSLSSVDSSFPRTEEELVYGDLNKDDDTAQIACFGSDGTLSISASEHHMGFSEIRSSVKSERDTACGSGASEADTIQL